MYYCIFYCVLLPSGVINDDDSEQGRGTINFLLVRMMRRCDHVIVDAAAGRQQYQLLLLMQMLY